MLMASSSRSITQGNAPSFSISAVSLHRCAAVALLIVRRRCPCARDDHHGLRPRRYLHTQEHCEVGLPRRLDRQASLAFGDNLMRSTYSPKDDSLNAAMLIALQNFKVKHIVVTVRDQERPLCAAYDRLSDLQGHTNCVGCTQALRMSLLPPTPPTTALQRFVQPVAALSRVLTTEDGPPTLDLLVEENVVQQVKNLVASEIIQEDWKRRGPNGVVIHGWVYHLENVSVAEITQSPRGSAD